MANWRREVGGGVAVVFPPSPTASEYLSQRFLQLLLFPLFQFPFMNRSPPGPALRRWCQLPLCAKLDRHSSEEGGGVAPKLAPKRAPKPRTQAKVLGL